jgi:hypothetical protein
MKSPVKLIKKAALRRSEKPVQTRPVNNENRWSKAVKSWVQEFQERRNEAPPAFDRLFKEVLE